MGMSRRWGVLFGGVLVVGGLEEDGERCASTEVRGGGI